MLTYFNKIREAKPAIYLGLTILQGLLRLTALPAFQSLERRIIIVNARRTPEIKQPESQAFTQAMR
jgi:hypothetical protein